MHSKVINHSNQIISSFQKVAYLFIPTFHFKWANPHNQTPKNVIFIMVLSQNKKQQQELPQLLKIVFLSSLVRVIFLYCQQVVLLLLWCCGKLVCVFVASFFYLHDFKEDSIPKGNTKGAVCVKASGKRWWYLARVTNFTITKRPETIEW